MSEEDGPASRVAIGLSFGNTNSSIAYTSAEGKAEVIANEEGDRQIPSILSYVDGEQFQGAQAKAQLVRNAKNTVAYFRDFLGQEFKDIDPTPCHQSAHPIEKDSQVAFSIQDTESEDVSTVSVSEITTRHIRRLAVSASDFLGKTVNAAVITVPTNFSDAQKEALRKAAADANIEVLQFISEPIAAVLAYDARPGASLSDKVVVVADFGGTRSDIAIIGSRGGIYTVLATAHDWDVSGTKFDDKLMEFFAKEFMKKHKNEDPTKNDRALAKLRLESEAVKKALSLGASASFSVESLSGGYDFTNTINRTRFELLSTQIFAAMTRLILQTVEKAELDPLDITDIILAGGTSHIPRIANNIKNSFPEGVNVWAPATKSDAINPSELSARGAAIQASLIADFEMENIKESCEPVVTVTPHLKHALGVLCISGDVAQGKFQPLIEADTPTPIRRTATITTPREGGDVLVKIVEGSRHIKVNKVENPAKANGATAKEADSDDSSEEEEDSDNDEEETREKVWHVGKVIAELAVKGVKKGGKVEVQVDVRPDLAVSIIAREVGAKGGVRGSVEAPKLENGSA
ncbi:heat shock protein-like protein 70 [Tothia fuscella]|uniref:Heat shock protein-like protein 70 n=1 Tax=Tothia fuscella TaxID=1048955 RepID=A0A9P4U1H9_9PEZI|nr:heat shock protein-like protein 70 [Tothia fuscella]